eukprot:CAMPEP_0170849712 /NCGR_PEP_ID=MMETSP0734-20130129/10181_1 /TAXON_ID=186038 /ORGANISM="Fragilariopsis kerguelensis, Strain L26-C5" /LENGTH=351 /DNA_ID=CAMNT_0011219453 /DNA_START=48 /DNA_END=1103 /DNA_ORIENTATION=-
MSSRMIDQHHQRVSLLMMVIAIIFAISIVDINNSIHHATTVSAFSISSTSTTRYISASASTSSSSSSSSSILSMASSMAAAPSPPLTMLPEGLLKTIVTRGQQQLSSAAAPIQRGDVVTVKYTCYAVGRDDDETDTTNVLLARSEQQKGVVGDGSMVPGWDAAVRSMNLGERAIIRITDPTLGYKHKQYDEEDSSSSPQVAALEALGISVDTQLELDLEILKIQTAKEAAELFDMNFDSMALADDTPRTPADIQAAYETKMALKAPDREGWEGWLDTVQNYYFFGLFEGETGQDAPWYLTPSISFPLAFSVVGAAFWISLASGAISEKGQQSIDELDLIVKTTTLFVSSSL